MHKINLKKKNHKTMHCEAYKFQEHPGSSEFRLLPETSGFPFLSESHEPPSCLQEECLKLSELSNQQSVMRMGTRCCFLPIVKENSERRLERRPSHIPHIDSLDNLSLAYVSKWSIFNL